MEKYTDNYFESLIEKEKTGGKITTGEAYACRAWYFSREKKSSMFECENFPFENDMEAFVWTLRNAGVDYLAVTEQSSALMRIMHQLRELNCTFKCIDTITRTEDRFGTVEKTKHQAVIFYVPAI